MFSVVLLSGGLEYTNYVYICQKLYDEWQSEYIQINNKFYFNVKPLPELISPTAILPVSGAELISPNDIAVNKYFKKYINISGDEKVKAGPFYPTDVSSSITFSVRLYNKYKVADCNDLIPYITNNFNKFVMSKKQEFIIPKYSTIIICESNISGCLIDTNTKLFFKEPSRYRLLNIPDAEINKIIDVNLEELGIGGLETEYATIFRRAFSTRVLPPTLLTQLNIKHVKGLLLYGPPGTGKTLFARELAKALTNDKNIQIVSGPELLNRYIGKSEENIRTLFAKAEDDYKDFGVNSKLHIIIFDEIDSICKTRRHTDTGTAENIVNQLLTKIDGMRELNNILIIGMTNRLDLIDKALLRPGRFEVQIAMKLPNLSDRIQILNIHTKKFREYNILDKDIDIPTIALQTNNYTGAELEGLVKSAFSFALERRTTQGIKIINNDFIRALKEINCSFSQDSNIPPVDYNPNFKDLFKHFDENQLTFISNSNAQCAYCYSKQFSLTRLFEAESVLGLDDREKILEIKKCFKDAKFANNGGSLIIFKDYDYLINLSARVFDFIFDEMGTPWVLPAGPPRAVVTPPKAVSQAINLLIKNSNIKVICLSETVIKENVKINT